MIGVCKRLSLVLVLALGMMSPVFAEGLDSEAVGPSDPTANSISNLSVTWDASDGTKPDTEVWMTYEANRNRLDTPSPWRPNQRYYALQPDPDPTITEVHTPVDVVESVYLDIVDGNITLPENAVGIKGIWADRWHRTNLWRGGAFNGTNIASGTYAAPPQGTSHVFVSYYKAGTRLVVVDKKPLPAGYTVYKYPVEAGWRQIVINPEILRLDPDTGGLRNGGDDWNNLIAVYDNESFKGTNYLEPPNAIIDRSTNTIKLAKTVPDGVKNLYVVVSTYAVDYLEIGGQRELPASYDEDTGEITLQSEAQEGQEITVIYRPLGRKRLTVAQVPIVDVTGVWLVKGGNQNLLGQKVFDAVTGKITLQNTLPQGTQSVYCEYTSVDMGGVTGQDTWTWQEGDRKFPLVRESDDMDQRYATLQPDPVSYGRRVSSDHPALCHGVDKVLDEAVNATLEDPDVEPKWIIVDAAREVFWPIQVIATVNNALEVDVTPYSFLVEDGQIGVDVVAAGLPVDSENPTNVAITRISYYAPGQNMVLVLGPLPMPATVREINLNSLNQPRSDILRINSNLLNFDPDTERWRGNAIDRDPTAGYNILGVFDNQDLTGWNYWTPGRGKVKQDSSGAALLRLNTVPHDSIARLFVKISSYAVDGVFTEQMGGHNYYPGRLVGVNPTDPANDPVNEGMTYAWYDPATLLSTTFDPNAGESYSILWSEIHLARSLPQPGQQVYVTWRGLSQTNVTPARGPVMSAPIFRYYNVPHSILMGVTNGNDKLNEAPPVFTVGMDGSGEDSMFPYGTRFIYDIGYYANMCIMGKYSMAVYAEGLGRFIYQPLYPAEENIVFRSAVSAGLNLRRIMQRPKYDASDAENPCLLRDPRGNPMDYAPLLVSDLIRPAVRLFKYVAATSPDTLGDAPDISESGIVATTVHAASPGYGRHDTVAYGGTYNYGLDWLTSYNTHPNFPTQTSGLDPLIPAAPSAIVPDALKSDNGAGSTSFLFLVRYWNMDNIPPRPWMKAWIDEFDAAYGTPTPTGVVLYLDLMNVLDLPVERRHESYRPHFMTKLAEMLGQTDNNYTDGCDYAYLIEPTSGNEYISLLTGSYHYFFGASDDSLNFELNDELLFEYQLPNDLFNWGQYPEFLRAPTRSSTGIDPFMARNIMDSEGRPFMPRPIGRRYSTYGDDGPGRPAFDTPGPQDWQIYVDRCDRVPGLFELDYPQQYMWKSTEHPEITLHLKGFAGDAGSGFPRFFGTIQPFYRAVNPSILTPQTWAGFGANASRMETCGATTSTTLTFRIKYFQRDNMPPLWIKTYINNTSLKVLDETTVQVMKPENGGYTGYTMQPAAVQTTPGQSQKAPYNYRIGVDYEFKTQLPAGPHTYFFMANDGFATALYPARPGNDLFIPGAGAAQDDPLGFDNNYCPGPYVNNPCQLVTPNVTPATGIQGQQYVYRVLYKDADGQRPYQTRIYIETGTDKGTIAVNMLKEDPTADDYVNGVWYVLNTATLEDFSLAKGTRHYRFEFIDDWGRPTDLNDVVKGETTLYPPSGSWVDGPTIGENVPPTLRFGKVESPDGTSNGATLWKFGVEYKDLNNDAPKFVTLYIGELQADGQSIKWDNGRQMIQSDPSDATYSDGCQFVFQTRLKQALNPADPQPIYYYAFEASDGVNLATWVSDEHPIADQISESAGCLLKDPLATDDQLVYRASRVPLVGTLQNQPTNAGILIDPIVWMYIRGDRTKPVIVSREDEYVCKGTNPGSVGAVQVLRYDPVDAAYQPNITDVLGVYDNPELTGIDYFHADDGSAGSYAFGGFITLKKSLPYGVNWVWIKYRHTRDDYHLTNGAPAALPDGTADLSNIVRTGAVEPNSAPEIHEVLAVYDDLGGDFFHALDGTPGSYDPATGVIALGRPLPVGTTAVTIKYRMPKYTLNRWAAEYTFDKAQDQADEFVSDYFFGTRHSAPIGINVPPTLSNPKLAPIVGASGTDFIYTVEYKETEGPNGQAPLFVRVVIDGVERDMTPTIIGKPSYRSGVIYQYAAKLNNGSHTYYFTASDGVGLVTLPVANESTGKIDPFLGPWVNDPPVLRDGKADPNPTGQSISTVQSVDYSVTYSDRDGDLPLNIAPFATDIGAADAVKLMTFPTPLVYVDNPTEAWNVGIVDEIKEDPAQPGKYRTIKVLSHDGQPAQYEADQFAGKLLQFVGGNLNGKVYLIANNTTDELKLMTDDLVTDGLETETTFSIGTLRMFKEPVTQQNYAAGVIYKLTVPQLAEGTHRFHYKAASVQTPPAWLGVPWNTMTQSSWVRLPGSGEINGPIVAPVAPLGNHIPVLSLTAGDTAVSPVSGKATDSYGFTISYRDADGDPPRYHDKVLGYVRVVFSDGKYAADLIPVVAEDQTDSTFYTRDRRFKVSANGLPEGNHKFHFEASDAWNKVRWPAAAQGLDPDENDPVVVVNAKATLTEMTVNPPNGDTNTTFQINVKFADANGQGPQYSGGKDQVWVEFGGDSANKLYLTRYSSDTNFTSGVIYRGVKTGLPAGAIKTVFKTKDNLGELTTVNGPTIGVSANMNAPTLAAPKVFNTTKPSDINAAASGGAAHSFRYEIKYTDPDGDMPVMIKNSSIVEGIKLYIDGKFEADVTQRVAQEYLPSGKPDYTKPVTYFYIKQGTTYTAGAHSYYFVAKDGSSTDAHTVQSPDTAGPVILSGTISLERRVMSTGGTWVDRDPMLAEKVKITSILSESDAKPIPGGQRFRITVTRPDGTGTSFTLNGAASETATVKKNQFSFELETPNGPMINKTWSITVKWDGNSDYTTPITSEIKVDVKGPTRVVATQDMSQPTQSAPAVDMVCMPLTAINGDAGSLFGYDRARLMQIVRWDPEQLTYMSYGETYFNQIGAGNAVWILPNALYPSESVSSAYLPSPVDPQYPVSAARQYRLLRPFGRLYDQKQDCEITLKQGWNQIGLPYLAPTLLKDAKVVYQGNETTIDQAAANGWIRNYAWMWDPVTQQADKLIHPTRSDAYKRTLDPWRGYWIRALVDCRLVLKSPSGGATAASLEVKEIGPTATSSSLPPLDMPPPSPVAGK